MSTPKTTVATQVGGRSYQEDEYISIATSDGGRLLAVADGHGGGEASRAVTQFLREHWYGVLPGHEEAALDVIVREAAIAVAFMGSGSTLSLAYIPPEPKEVFIAVVGDSPVIAATGDTYHVSPEHNVRTNLAERAAAEKRGGRYAQGYMWQLEDGLQMGRALGDRGLGFLSHEPEVYSLPLGNWVLVATDGVFDPSHVQTESEISAVVGMIEKGADAVDLVNRAVNLPTGDNATAILWRR